MMLDEPAIEKYHYKKYSTLFNEIIRKEKRMSTVQIKSRASTKKNSSKRFDDEPEDLMRVLNVDEDDDEVLDDVDKKVKKKKSTKKYNSSKRKKKKGKGKKKKGVKKNEEIVDNLNFDSDEEEKMESSVLCEMEDNLYGDETLSPEKIRAIKKDKKRIKKRVEQVMKMKEKVKKKNKKELKEEKKMKRNIITRAANAVWGAVKWVGNKIMEAVKWVGKLFGFGRKAEAVG